MNFREEAKSLVSQMTLREKVALCSGSAQWRLMGVERLSLAGITVSDGPHGLRKPHPDAKPFTLGNDLPATCFPPACALACSFDRDLLSEIGTALAEECISEGISVLLGPGVNIKRNPLCGRNFEYFSEDPCLSGKLAVPLICAMQDKGVGASLKHFACNNQETRRNLYDSVVDERALFEIYFPAFEHAVKKAQPWTVMSSYNKLYGVHASESEFLLTEILRKKWGFQGLTVSDWGAVDDRVAGVKAGLDLEMPYTGPYNGEQLVRAVEEKKLPIESLDAAALHVTELLLRAKTKEPLPYDRAAHHALAAKAAERCAVLLKNQDSLLPGTVSQNAAVIGAFAKSPRFQGTGSSKIVPNQLETACDVFQSMGLSFTYAEGFSILSDETDEALEEAACTAACGKDIIYFFAGLPDRYESEGYDRETLFLPENQLSLIRKLRAVNENLVVILSGGSVIDLGFEKYAKAILMCYLGGQAGAVGACSLLLGEASPSAKLAESWPLSLDEVPSYRYFPGYPRSVEYRESIFVGYRYYDTANTPVRYPFGFGLSYTEFSYSELSVTQEKEQISVTVLIRNTGNRAGAEIVQLYTGQNNPSFFRPVHELRDFQKIYLLPGEAQKLSFTLSRRDFSYYNTEIHDFCIEEGTYRIEVAASSRDIRLSETVFLHGDGVPIPAGAKLSCYRNLKNGLCVSPEEFQLLCGFPLPQHARNKKDPHTADSSVLEISDRFLGRLVQAIMKRIAPRYITEDDLMASKSLPDSPLRGAYVVGMSRGAVEGFVKMLNGHFFKGLRQLIKYRKE